MLFQSGLPSRTKRRPQQTSSSTRLLPLLIYRIQDRGISTPERVTLFRRTDTSVQLLQRISIVKAPNLNSLEANSAFRNGPSSSACHGDHAPSWRYEALLQH